ncbi:MAG TPA: response regulator transcription factor [Edaphobacter sp.]|nr:response regulator transcription factor [Edaphobacter sp.]
MISILVADDHLVFRMGLKTMLGTEPDMQIVGEANSASSTVESYRRLKPDVTVLDLRMPGGGGIQALREIRAQDNRARILVLSSYASEEEVYSAIRAGASGYVLKDVDQEELTAAIRKTHAGQRYLPAELAELIAERAPRPELTPREHEVLQLIARGLINREIAQILGTSESTVRNHTIHLFAKLDVSDRTEAATFALQRGIICL